MLVPEVSCRYFPRRSLPQVWRMYYQYGYFKPLVARKVGRVMTVRQLVPSILVASLISLACLSPIIPGAGVLFASIAGAYALLVLACSAATATDLRCGMALAAVFPTLHISYGLGFLRGIYDHLLSQAVPKPVEIRLSR